jgi:serine/threonine-protein kinase
LPGKAKLPADAKRKVVPDEAADREANDMQATRVIPDFSSSDADTDSDSNPPEAAATAAPKGYTVSSIMGDFRLLKKLGKGAMATVYKAKQISFNRDVALKILYKHIAENKKLVERFYREARVMGELDHPNIVQGFTVGEHEGLHYFAMEYVRGESLQKWIDRFGRLSVPDAVHVTLACTRALGHAHSKGLVHRDIKPENILITREGVVKVSDLGMVKVIDEDMSLTQTGYAVGTPWYMPLEQARNAKDTDGRSDIYALGCMLYHMLVGRPPFTSLTIVDLIKEKEAGVFAPARQLNNTVPERLDLIIAKMAAKYTRHRYQTCEELVQDLEALGLAGPALSFLQIPGTEKPGPSEESQPHPENAKTLQTTAVAKTVDLWHIRYKKKDGKPGTLTLTTGEIVRMLSEGKLSPTLMASRHPEDGFRALPTYKEFEHAALHQAAKTQSDRATEKYRDLYKKLESQSQSARGDDEDENRSTKAVTHYWIGLALKILLPLGALAGLAWFLKWVAKAVS